MPLYKLPQLYFNDAQSLHTQRLANPHWANCIARVERGGVCRHDGPRVQSRSRGRGGYIEGSGAAGGGGDPHFGRGLLHRYHQSSQGVVHRAGGVGPDAGRYVFSSGAGAQWHGFRGS